MRLIIENTPQQVAQWAANYIISQIKAKEQVTTSLFDLTREQTLDLSKLDTFVVVMCLEGRGTLTDDRGESIAVHQGETVLLPATTRTLRFTPEGKMKLLTSWIA